MKYEILLMNGKVYEVDVPNDIPENKRENVAYSICVTLYPEIAFADLLDIKAVEGINE